MCKKFEVLGKKVVVETRDCAVSFKALDADRKNRPPATSRPAPAPTPPTPLPSTARESRREERDVRARERRCFRPRGAAGAVVARSRQECGGGGVASSTKEKQAERTATSGADHWSTVHLWGS